MRRIWMGLFIALLCLPLAFTIYLFAAAKLPSLDRITLALPMGIRQPVAQIVMRGAGYGKDSTKKIDRVLLLDPENTTAWNRRCSAATGVDAIAYCNIAIGRNPTAWNYRNLGHAQEEAKDFCSAETSYTKAIGKAQNSPVYLRSMGIAALRCGHIGAGQAGLEVAEGIDAKTVAKAAANPNSSDSDADDDDLDDAKDDLVLDREYLAVVYDRSKEPAKAVEACAKAHPDLTACHCELTDKAVTCAANVATRAAKPKSP
jgi:tetratricopeptide (TPR) repeat protein